MPRLAQYDANGKPTGVYYEQLSTLLLAQAQRQQRVISDLRSSQRTQARTQRTQARELRGLRAQITRNRDWR